MKEHKHEPGSEFDKDKEPQPFREGRSLVGVSRVSSESPEKSPWDQVVNG